MFNLVNPSGSKWSYAYSLSWSISDGGKLGKTVVKREASEGIFCAAEYLHASLVNIVFKSLNLLTHNYTHHHTHTESTLSDSDAAFMLGNSFYR
jgi:hypothetical protein